MPERAGRYSAQPRDLKYRVAIQSPPGTCRGPGRPGCQCEPRDVGGVGWPWSCRDTSRAPGSRTARSCTPGTTMTRRTPTSARTGPPHDVVRALGPCRARLLRRLRGVGPMAVRLRRYRPDAGAGDRGGVGRHRRLAVSAPRRAAPPSGLRKKVTRSGVGPVRGPMRPAAGLLMEDAEALPLAYGDVTAAVAAPADVAGWPAVDSSASARI
jgi:hypothetical protein